MANICCSIEMEPKTLNEVQLNQAREVAADVIQKMEAKEASIIFIKGLEQAKVEENERMEKQEEQLHKLVVECNVIAANAKPQIIETPCQCSLNNISVDSPDLANVREPLSAPF